MAAREEGTGLAGARVLDGDEVEGVLSGAFYTPSGGARAKRSDPPSEKPAHYKVICISLYTDDLERLDGRPRHSFGHLRRGLTELHTWQSSFGSLDLQSGVAGHGRELALAGLALAVDDGRPSVVLEWSERTRSVASRVTPVRPPRDEAASAALSELRVLQAQEPAPGSAGERRMVELRRQVRELSWRGDGSHDLARPCSLAELQAGLGPDTALVAHVTSPYRLTALVVTQRRATVRALGQRSTLAALLGGLRADLDLASADLPARLAASVRDPLRWRLVELGGLLIDPVADLVGDRSVVLTPSARLAGIPWGCLPGLAGRSVTVAQSATGWRAFFRMSTTSNAVQAAAPARTSSIGRTPSPRPPCSGAPSTTTACPLPVSATNAIPSVHLILAFILVSMRSLIGALRLRCPERTSMCRLRGRRGAIRGPASGNIRHCIVRRNMRFWNRRRVPRGPPPPRRGRPRATPRSAPSATPSTPCGSACTRT